MRSENPVRVRRLVAEDERFAQAQVIDSSGQLAFLYQVNRTAVSARHHRERRVEAVFYFFGQVDEPSEVVRLGDDGAVARQIRADAEQLDVPHAQDFLAHGKNLLFVLIKQPFAQIPQIDHQKDLVGFSLPSGFAIQEPDCFDLGIERHVCVTDDFFGFGLHRQSQQHGFLAGAVRHIRIRSDVLYSGIGQVLHGVVFEDFCSDAFVGAKTFRNDHERTVGLTRQAGERIQIVVQLSQIDDQLGIHVKPPVCCDGNPAALHTNTAPGLRKWRSSAPFSPV